MRLELVTECEHGQYKFHMNQGGDVQGIDCSGGTRRVLDPDALHPEMVEAGVSDYRRYEGGFAVTSDMIGSVLQAALTSLDTRENPE